MSHQLNASTPWAVGLGDKRFFRTVIWSCVWFIAVFSCGTIYQGEKLRYISKNMQKISTIIFLHLAEIFCSCSLSIHACCSRSLVLGWFVFSYIARPFKQLNFSIDASHSWADGSFGGDLGFSLCIFWQGCNWFETQEVVNLECIPDLFSPLFSRWQALHFCLLPSHPQLLNCNITVYDIWIWRVDRLL